MEHWLRFQAPYGRRAASPHRWEINPTHYRPRHWFACITYPLVTFAGSMAVLVTVQLLASLAVANLVVHELTDKMANFADFCLSRFPVAMSLPSSSLSPCTGSWERCSVSQTYHCWVRWEILTKNQQIPVLLQKVGAKVISGIFCSVVGVFSPSIEAATTFFLPGSPPPWRMER